MPQRTIHTPLDALISKRLVRHLKKEASGADSFTYDQTWLDWEPAFAILLPPPLRETDYRGGAAMAAFDNLRPDNLEARTRLAERVGVHLSGGCHSSRRAPT